MSADGARHIHGYMLVLQASLMTTACHRPEDQGSMVETAAPTTQIDDLLWFCERPITDYFLATQAAGFTDNTYETPLHPNTDAVFLSFSSDGDIKTTSAFPGLLDAIYFQAKQCDFSNPRNQCGQYFSLKGHYGPLQSDPSAAYAFTPDMGAWCHDKGNPLFFTGVMYFDSLARTIAVHLQDSGERSATPVTIGGGGVLVLSLDFDVFEVSNDCTYETLPCDGDLLISGRAHRAASIPPDGLD